MQALTIVIKELISALSCSLNDVKYMNDKKIPSVKETLQFNKTEVSLLHQLLKSKPCTSSFLQCMQHMGTEIEGMLEMFFKLRMAASRVS